MPSRRRTLAAALLALAALAVTPPKGHAAPLPEISYDLDETLAPTRGAAELELLPEGAEPTFYEDLVAPGWRARSVLAFAPGEGARIDAAALPTREAYTLELVLDPGLDGGTQRLVDLSDGQGDAGLYLRGGHLALFDERALLAVSDDRVPPDDVYRRVTLVRAPGATVSVFVDGRRTLGPVADPHDELVLGDGVPLFYDAAGTVADQELAAVLARARLFARALGEDEVRNLSGLDFFAPTTTLVGAPVRTRDTTPSFSGVVADAEDPAPEVLAAITRNQEVVSELRVGRDGAAWSATSPPLADGTYGLRLWPVDMAGNVRHDYGAVEIDTTPPTQPRIADPLPQVATSTPPAWGGAWAHEGDTESVRIRVHAGGAVTGPVVEDRLLPITRDGWRSTLGPLAPGPYLFVVEHADQLGNLARAERRFQVGTSPGSGGAPPPPIVIPRPPVDDVVRSAARTRATRTVAALRRVRLRDLARRGSVRLPVGPGAVRVRLGRSPKGALFAKATGRTLRLTTKGRAAARRSRRLELTVRTTARLAGAVATAERRVVLVRG